MMPDNQHRNGEMFDMYDAMSTEELQQLLREDASKPVGEESDTDALVYIMEVLAKRRKERNEGKSPAEALESFKNKYYSETENSSDSESAAVTKKHFNSGRWRRGLVAAVAAICILVVGNSITASAFGFDLWEIIAKWTKETFHFGYAGTTSISGEPNGENTQSFSGLQAALDDYDIATSLVPTWFPDGYEEVDVRIFDNPMQRQFIAKYQAGDNEIKIWIADYLDSDPDQIEQDESTVEVYESNGIYYYIFSDVDTLQAAWITEGFECYITGPLTLSEIKEMIDSIGKG